MSKKAWTPPLPPAPWRAIERRLNSEGRYVMAGSAVVAFVYDQGREYKDPTQFIAAAPKMYEALKAVKGMIQFDEDLWIQVCDAIKEAEGN